ncbi:NADH-quinone oxidoreductase subunit K [Sulfolobales archaeon HS-7]|nr:NADH-quinone oxidoreductase subunit K [Sulfolobales archaeon HS-7]
MILPYLGFAVSVILVSIGFYGVFNSKNVIRIILSSEVILNGSILAIFSLAFAEGLTYLPIILGVFGIGMALTEVVVAFAAVILYYRLKNKLEVT